MYVPSIKGSRRHRRIGGRSVLGCPLLLHSHAAGARGRRSIDLVPDWIVLSGSQTMAVVWAICSGDEIVAVLDGATTHTTCNSGSNECNRDANNRDVRGAGEASML